MEIEIRRNRRKSGLYELHIMEDGEWRETMANGVEHLGVSTLSPKQPFRSENRDMLVDLYIEYKLKTTRDKVNIIEHPTIYEYEQPQHCKVNDRIKTITTVEDLQVIGDEGIIEDITGMAVYILMDDRTQIRVINSDFLIHFKVI